jgi:hypothetical protein
MLEYVDKEKSEYIGKINDETYKNFLNAQNNISLMQQRIGILEVQKAELIRLIQEESKKATELMMEEGKRMGVPDGKDWHITKDGEAFLGKAPEAQS